MLVKLGDIWIDPNQVIFITAHKDHVAVSIKEDGWAGGIPIVRTTSLDESKILQDEYAYIINNTIVIQTFGGIPDEAESPES